MFIENIRKRKLLTALVFVTIIFFVIGVLFISILSEENQELIKSSINGYFTGLSKGKITYLKGLFSTMTGNLLLGTFIWVIGISIIGILFVVLLLVVKSFLVGFSFTGIIYTFGIKGMLMALIYILPEVLNLFIIFVLVYYSISFSALLFNHLFKKREFNRTVIVSRYLKLFIICLGLFIITSLVSVFLVPNILRMF